MDQIWNMGESPDGPDVGGARGVDPLNALQPTFVSLLPGGGWHPHAADPLVKHYIGSFGIGVLGLAEASASSLFLGNGGQNHLSWQTFALGARSYLASTPYVPWTAPGGPWWLPIDLFRPFIWHEAGHWIMPFGGVKYEQPGTNPTKHWLAWWQRAGDFTHLIQRLTYTVTGGQAQNLEIWGSTQRALAGNVGPPRFPPTHPDYVKALRSEMGEVAPMNMQTVRIGRVMPGDTPQVVASGMGGRVMLLDGDTGRVVAESKDYGLGGMALAVGNLDADDRDEIVFAPFYDPIVPGVQTVRSTLRVLKWVSGQLQSWPIASLGVPLGEPANADFPGYGACGLAIVDLSVWPLQPALGKVVIASTLNGELVIFEVLADGSLHPQPLLRKVLHGAIGAYGSIVVANLDTSNPKPELYLAGSSGIRRFDFQ